MTFHKKGRWCVLMVCLSVLCLSAGADSIDIVEDVTFGSGDNVVRTASSQVLSYQNVTVQSGARLIFIGGNQVIIHPGFHAQRGSDFTATTGFFDPSLLTTPPPISGRARSQPAAQIDPFNIPAGIALNVHRPAQ